MHNNLCLLGHVSESVVDADWLPLCPSTQHSPRSMFADMSNSIPGVDEAMSFAELMKMVQNMDFSCIVFDTAPTGHTLRLLSFPTIMNKALSKLMDLKNKFSGLFSQFGNMFGGGGVSQVGEPSVVYRDRAIGRGIC